MVSIAFARDPEIPNHSGCATGSLNAIALGIANMRLGPGETELEFRDVHALCTSGSHAEVGRTISCRNETELLYAATRMIEVPQSPLLVTWNGSADIPYLRSRAFAGDRRADWLLKASSPGTEELASAYHLDLSRYLFPEGFSVPIEQALFEIGAPRSPEVIGLARLEIAACGLLLLAAKALWFRAEISVEAYNLFVGSFSERARHLSAARPHFGCFVFDEGSNGEQQQ